LLTKRPHIAGVAHTLAIGQAGAMAVAVAADGWLVARVAVPVVLAHTSSVFAFAVLAWVWADAGGAI